MNNNTDKDLENAKFFWMLTVIWIVSFMVLDLLFCVAMYFIKHDISKVFFYGLMIPMWVIVPFVLAMIPSNLILQFGKDGKYKKRTISGALMADIFISYYGIFIGNSIMKNVIPDSTSRLVWVIVFWLLIDTIITLLFLLNEKNKEIRERAK